VLQVLVVSIVSTLVKVFVAWVDANTIASALSGGFTNPSNARSKPPIEWSTRANTRHLTPATCARGRPRVSICGSSRPDDLNGVSLNVG
jgi:hypothetical protein